MSRVLALDPGSKESAWLLLVDGRPERWAKEPNDVVRDMLRWTMRDPGLDVDRLVGAMRAEARHPFTADDWVTARRIATAYGPVHGAAEASQVLDADLLVIETIEPRGERLYSQVVDMLIWAGRFAEAARPLRVEWLSREAIKRHLAPPKGRGASSDADVRSALMERFGGDRAVSVGTKAAPGPLHGISRDCWAALAVAVCWADGLRREAA